MTTLQDLRLINDLFGTNLLDVDAVDTTHLWETVEQELRSATVARNRNTSGARNETGLKKALVSFRLRYQEQLTYREISERVGLSGGRVQQLILRCLRQLRHPERLNRIKSTCPGWFNVHQPVPKLPVKPKPVPKFKGVDPASLYYVPTS